MVFNSGFDKSLWLILLCENKYRFNIAKFIYNIPKEIYDSICNQLNECNNYNEYDTKCVRKAIINQDDVNSYYCIDISPCEIIINLKRWNSVSDRLNEEIELVLYSLDKEDTDDNYLCYLGKYSFNSSKFFSPFSSVLTFVGDLREYEIYDVDDMTINICVSEDSEMIKNVSLKSIPKELVLTDLRDRRSVKKLVRGRK